MFWPVLTEAVKAPDFSTITTYQPEADIMSKEKKGNKESKKAPLLTAKEKKAAKKAKKSSKGVFDD